MHNQNFSYSGEKNRFLFEFQTSCGQDHLGAPLPARLPPQVRQEQPQGRRRGQQEQAEEEEEEEAAGAQEEEEEEAQEVKDQDTRLLRQHHYHRTVRNRDLVTFLFRIFSILSAKFGFSLKQLNSNF